MNQSVQKYFEHLDQIFKVEPAYFSHSKEGDFPPFYSLTYKDIPEKGMVSGFTSGVSFAAPKGIIKTELMVSVDSRDDVWVLALADIGYRNRGQEPYQVGDTINFNSVISEESEMTSFFVWHQSLINEKYETVCLPCGHIKLLQLFPIHDDERILIHKYGPEWLFELVDDPSNIKRASVADKFKT